MFRYTLVRLVVLFVVLAAVDVACQIAPQLLHLPWLLPKSGAFAIASGVGLALAMIIAYRLLVRAIEGRPANELGRANAISYLVAGSIGGALLFAAVYALLLIRGVAFYNGYAGLDELAGAAGAALGAAVGEEIVFRGVIFRVAEEAFGTLSALVVSAVLFGLLHAFNHGATPVSTAAIALEAGVLLAASYAASRSLWLPIGIHFGWNFTEGGIFGAAVSGGGVTHGVFKVVFAGDKAWTGGLFGPEASLASVMICLAAAILFVGLAIAGGQWQRARLRMRTA